MRSRFSVAIFAMVAIGFAATNPPPVACAPPTTGPKLSSPCRHYSLKLTSLFTPPSHAMGLLLKARIDGGPALRLLLDSGAQYIVLDKRTTAALGRSAGSALELVGIGAAAKAARRIASGTVEIGDLTLRGCEMLAIDGKLLEGIDGVIPLSLFADFLVHLDVPGKTLDLDPYQVDWKPQGSGYSSARVDNHLLFLQAVVNESQSGYVLLDTGATYNAVAPAAAGAWKNYRISAPSISLLGGAGETDGFLLPPGVKFRFGSQVLAADPAVVLDLSDIARHHQFEVAGVLGYPALYRSIVTVDYRDSLVRMDAK